MKILLTGASSGIGREMALILAKTCNEMVLVARNYEALEKLKDEILNENNINVTIISKDLSEYKNCIELHDEIKDVDLLINNAGFGDTGLFEKTSLDKDLSMINTNVVALHTLTKLYLKDMKEKDSGHILNVASIAGFMPGPLMATYYATKTYVVKLSESIKEELKREKSKVKISILCPGPIATQFEKRANIDFKFNGVSSEYVAKYAIKHLNRFYIIPQLKIKLAIFILKFIPKSLSAKIIPVFGIMP